MIPFIQNVQKEGKSTETERRAGGGRRKCEEQTAKEYKLSFRSDENVLKRIAVTDAQL